MKIATFATFPERDQFAQRVAEDILPQVDRLQIYFNGYRAIPDWAKAGTKESVIHGFLGQGEDDLGDAGKFFLHDEEDAYYIVIDDDLYYPPDFVEQLVAGIEKYGRQVAVTFHGRLLNPALSGRYTSYYRGAGHVLRSCRTLGTVKQDTYIHCPGTNAFAYHTDTIRFHIDDFKHYWPDGRNMADIWTGIKCKAQGVPIVCLAHQQGWITHQPIDLERTIYAWEVNNDGVQTKAINEFGPWPFPRHVELTT